MHAAAAGTFTANEIRGIRRTKRMATTEKMNGFEEIGFSTTVFSEEKVQSRAKVDPQMREISEFNELKTFESHFDRSGRSDPHRHDDASVTGVVVRAHETRRKLIV